MPQYIIVYLGGNPERAAEIWQQGLEQPVHSEKLYTPCNLYDMESFSPWCRLSLNVWEPDHR